jgi:hypothetical protein
MLFIDVDGVLADFCGAACKVHGKPGYEVTHWNFYEDWGMTEDEFWLPIHNGTQKFWEDLEPYPWTQDLLKMVRKADPDFFICTKPSTCPASLAGKMSWLQRHVSPVIKNYIMAPQKWPLAQPGRLLIDDSDENCQGFAAHGGSVLLFPRPWNASAGMDPLLMVQTALESYSRKEEMIYAGY